MFNGTTNRLLEKTNEELSHLNIGIHRHLTEIENKLASTPVAPVKKTNNFIVPTVALVLLVILQIVQQARLSTFKSLAEENNEAVRKLNQVINANTAAFNQLQTSNDHALRLNEALQSSINDLKGQNEGLTQLNKKLILQYSKAEQNNKLLIQKISMQEGEENRR